MSQAYSGVEGNVFAGATDVDTQGWNADIDLNTFDSTTTADGGYDDETGASKKISGSFDFFYNPSKPPMGSTLNLTPGATPTLKLYVNKTANIYLSGVALIKKLSLKSKVREGFLVTANWVNKGAWTLPT